MRKFEAEKIPCMLPEDILQQHTEGNNDYGII